MTLLTPERDSKTKTTEQTVRDYERALTPFVYSIVRDPHTVDDVVQETIIHVLFRAETYDWTQPVEPLLRAIAWRKIQEALRRNGRVILCDEAMLVRLEHSFQQFDQKSDGESDMDHTGLEKCLGALHRDDREVMLILSKFMVQENNQTSFESIAAELGRTPAAVKRQWYRVLEQLRACLNARKAVSGGVTR